MVQVVIFNHESGSLLQHRNSSSQDDINRFLKDNPNMIIENVIQTQVALEPTKIHTTVTIFYKEPSEYKDI